MMNKAFESLDGVDAAELATLLETGPLIRIGLRAGRARAARGLFLVEAPAETLWKYAGDIHQFPSLINMVDSVRHLPPTPDGQDVVRVNLKFKITFLKVKFHFVASVREKEGQHVDLRYHSGKLRDVAIDVEVAPVDENRSVLLSHVGFDPMSLGWLVKAFLRHHPEIEGGLHAGSVMSIAQAAMEASEKEHRRNR